jgi:hypothetical protein
MRHLRRHANVFAQRGVGVDSFANVHRVCALLNRQCNLTNHVASVRADHAAAKILPWLRPAWPFPDPASGESSNSSLVTASKLSLAMVRPDAVQGNKPFFTLMPCALALASV